MNITLITTIIFLYAIAALFHVLYWTYVWQLKSYRTDRMRDFFSTRTGKRALFSLRTFAHLALVLLFLCVHNFNIFSFGSVTTSLWILIAFLGLQNILFLNNRIRPQWTIKAIAIALGSFMVLLAIVPVLINEELIAQALFIFPLALLLSPLVVSVFVLLLRPVTALQRQRTIESARERIQAVAPIVVGITGSYGKTSTKEFLRTILERRFRVFATPKNINVDIGVADAILGGLEDNTDVAIIEMGAYRPGEIDAICDLVSPIIGIITAIANQHYALFGSLEAIQDAKSELIESLPQSGLAILNNDSVACAQVSHRTRATKKLFSMESTAHVHATDVVVTPEQVQFTLHIGTNSAPAHANLHGKQVIPAILASATVADHLGMTMEEIVEGIATLEPIDAAMHVQRGRGGMLVIDDHYSANPDGFIAALDYLRTYGPERKKIVITRGMDELGEQAYDEHVAVGNAIAADADILIITKKDFAVPLAEGAKEGGMGEEAIIVSERPARLIEESLSHLTPNDVVLIENRIHPSLIEYLLKR